jgi:hypothetical protein
MSIITVKSKNTQAFRFGRDEAFRLLFTMIMSDKDTEFWFGITSDGDVSLHINCADFCKSIAEYQVSDKPEQIWIGGYFERLSAEGKKEKLNDFYKNPMNIHQAFMKEYGDQAKDFWSLNGSVI